MRWEKDARKKDLRGSSSSSSTARGGYFGSSSCGASDAGTVIQGPRRLLRVSFCSLTAAEAPSLGLRHSSRYSCSVIALPFSSTSSSCGACVTQMAKIAPHASPTAPHLPYQPNHPAPAVSQQLSSQQQPSGT